MPDFVPNVILPEHFREAKVIFVGSPEHEELLKKADNAAKAKKELEDLKNIKDVVDEQLRNNEQITNKLIIERNKLEIQVSKQQTTIWKLIMTVGGLSIGLVFLIKIKLFG